MTDRYTQVARRIATKAFRLAHYDTTNRYATTGAWIGTNGDTLPNADFVDGTVAAILREEFPEYAIAQVAVNLDDLPEFTDPTLAVSYDTGRP